MKQRELAKLIENDMIKGITIQGDARVGEWEIAIDVDSTVADLYATMIDGAKTWVLETERGGLKTYTSIDRAYAALRALGWDGLVTIAG